MRPTAPLIPMPTNYWSVTGDCNIAAMQSIYFADERLQELAEFLAAQLAKYSLQLAVSNEAVSEATHHIALEIAALPTQTESESAYTLSIADEKITLQAAQPSGIFYGIQTLLQLLPVATNTAASEEPNQKAGELLLPCAYIEDQARFKYRGMHLDVSRHFFTVPQIKQYLDLLAMHKMNYFHWHLVDDQGWRIEIKKYPKLTEIGSQRSETVVGHTLNSDSTCDGKPHGGFYTQEDIKEIVAYAAQRYITIIPEVDLPGHCSALLASYPEYSCNVQAQEFEVETHFGIFRNILCCKDTTFAFLTDIFTEIAALFPGKYIHVGGDEVKMDRWQQCPDCQAIRATHGFKSGHQLHGYFIDKLVKILSTLGKKTICWDDTLESDNLDTDVTIMSWLGEDRATAATQLGHDLIMTQTNLYFDFYQSLSIDEPMAIHGHSPLRGVYEYDPVANLPEEHRDILGAQANVWSEYIRDIEHLQYVILPRMSALSEVLWTPKHQQNWASFKQRLEPMLERFEAMGLNASRSHYVPEITAKLLENNRFQVEIFAENPALDTRFTVDGNRPTVESQHYSNPLEIHQDTTIQAVCINPKTGKEYGVARLALSVHKALGCEVVVTPAGVSELIEDSVILHLDHLGNGRTGQGQIFQHSEWAELRDVPKIDFSLDLNSNQEVSHVSLGFKGNLGRNLHTPSALQVLTSTDNKSWVLQQQINDQHSINAEDRVSLDFNPTEARYVRVIIENFQQIYSREEQGMVTKLLFIDEIIVK